MSFQRARSYDQIEVRKHEIILAASHVYKELGYEGLNFNSIAKHTNITRSSIYNYFETKEEILLLILVNDLNEWSISFGAQFSFNKVYSIKDISTIWTECLMKQERLIELHSILFTIIAKNVSQKYLECFEQASNDSRKSMAIILVDLFPKATQESLVNFTFSALSLALGQFPLAKVNDMFSSKITENSSCIDFKSNYIVAINQLLYGLEHDVFLG